MKIEYSIHKIFVKDYDDVKDFIHKVVWFGLAEEDGVRISFSGTTDSPNLEIVNFDNIQ